MAANTVREPVPRRSNSIIVAAVILASILLSIYLNDLVIIFYGIVLAMLYYLLSVCTNNSRNNTELLSTMLSKLSENNPSQVQELHEIEINGVKLKVGDADYIRLLEARTERTEKK